MRRYKFSFWTVALLAVAALGARAFGVDIGYTEDHVFASTTSQYDHFGNSVAISGDTIIVGSNEYLNDGTGAAYVFVRSGTTWTQQQKLVASDGEPGDGFGKSVAIDGNTVIVGAWFDDGPAGFSLGSAYVFVRSGTTWTQQQKLVASDGEEGDYFGSEVAISGNTAIMGVASYGGAVGDQQGSAYVFVRSGTTWTQQAHLFASDAATGDFFGASVAIDGNTAIVGASGDDGPAGSNRGSAYVFLRSGTTWTQQSHLFASDPAPDDYFGSSVAIDGNTVIVGAYSDEGPVGTDQGSAYVFLRSETTWTQQAHLFASDAAVGDFFGSSVGIDGNTAIVGAHRDDGPAGDWQGSVYVFVRSGITWTQRAHLFASDAAAGDFFGEAIAISGNSAIVGASYDNMQAGSAYVFDPECAVLSDTSPCTRVQDSYAGPGGGFPNPAGMALPLFVPDSGIITDVELTMDVSFPDYGPVNVRLQHGPTVFLMAAGSTGSPGDLSGLVGVYTFDDEASTTLKDAAVAAPENVPVGVYRGLGSLSAFDGMDMFGPWTIFVENFSPPPPMGHDLNGWTLTITSESDDDNACTCTRCVSGVCTQVGIEFGNTNCSTIALPNLDDILCALSGFASFANCPHADIAPTTGPMACQGNDTINLDDILAALSAFRGNDPCGCTP